MRAIWWTCLNFMRTGVRILLIDQNGDDSMSKQKAKVQKQDVVALDLKEFPAWVCKAFQQYGAG